MRIQRVCDVCAHTASRVARVTTLNRVAREAARRLRTRFNRVSDHEIPAVYLAGLDLLRPPRFDFQILRHVMTRLTLGLRVTALAQLSLLPLSHDISVMAQERAVVLQKCLRHGVAKRLRLMARRALRLRPLLLVLVTAEALAHRRQWRAFGVDDAGVTRHALAANFRHCQVLVVVDRDLAAGTNRGDGQHRAHLARVAMTALTNRCPRQALAGVVRDDVVTAHAAQARRLARRTTGDAREVHLVRKARRRRLPLTGHERRQRKRKPEQPCRKA